MTRRRTAPIGAATAALALVAAACTGPRDRATTPTAAIPTAAAGAATASTTTTTSASASVAATTTQAAPSTTVAPPCAGDPGWSNRQVDFDHDGTPREYLVATPDVPASGRRLLVNLHGWSGNARHLDEATGLAAAGTAAGLVVVTPQALGDPTEWNFTGNPDAAADYEFLDSLVTDALGRYCVGTGEVVVVGTSNGAAMAGLYSCRDLRVVAVVMVIATVPCVARGRAASALTIRATGDPIVPYEGAADALAAWAATAGCDAAASESRPWGAVTRVEYDGCPDGVHVAFDTIDGGTHAWPDGATDAIVRFVSRDGSGS